MKILNNVLFLFFCLIIADRQVDIHDAIWIYTVLDNNLLETETDW